MQAPRVLWIDLRSRRETPSPHARLRALCTTLLLGLADPSNALEAATIDKLVAFYQPGMLLFEFECDTSAWRSIVEGAQRRHPQLPILMLTGQSVEIDFANVTAGWLDMAGRRHDDARTTRTRAAVDYVQQSLAQHITLATAAARCHMCKSEFSRIFKREHAATFFEFVLRARARRAAELLAQGDIAVKQVAYAVGFNDLSYFGRVFRRHYGVAPSQYLARQRPLFPQKAAHASLPLAHRPETVPLA